MWSWGERLYKNRNTQDYKGIKNKKEKNKSKIYHGKGESKTIERKKIEPLFIGKSPIVLIVLIGLFVGE